MAIRVIVAGLGVRGRQWVREIRTDPAWELAACVEVDPDRLAAGASELAMPGARCFPRLSDALDRVACDAVVVATSADTHPPVCAAALERGLAVLVEKPFALGLDAAVRLVELAERRRAPLVVGQNYRYMRVHRAARRLIGEGALGRVASVVSQYYRGPHAMAASLARLPHSILWGMAVHHLDALRHVLGQDITGVSAQTFTRPWTALPDGASVQALLTFADGARGVYSGTYESSGHEFFEGGQEFYQRYVGEQATLHVFHRWLVLCARGRLPRLVRRGRREISEERLLLRQLGRALLHGEEPDASGRDNLATMAVLEAMVRSAAERRWIDAKELLHAAVRP